MLTIGPMIERTLASRSAFKWKPAVAAEPRPARRDGPFAWLPRHLSIRLALAATFGVIIAVTATALILALESGRQNTIDLVRDRSDRIIGAILDRTRLHLEPARDQSRFIARLVADGALDPRDEADFTSHLSAALAGTPQVSALAVIRTDLRQLRVERQGDAVVARSIDMKTVPGLQDAFEMAKNAGQPLWGELLWSARLSQPLVNIRTPLWREGSFIGILLTTVTVTELSAFLADSPARLEHRCVHPLRPRAGSRPHGARPRTFAVQAGSTAARDHRGRRSGPGGDLGAAAGPRDGGDTLGRLCWPCRRRQRHSLHLSLP